MKNADIRKEENYNESDIRIANFAKALSHPARIEILKYLAGSGTASFHDVANEIPLARSTVSQHLDELKESGLVISTVSTPFVNYSINKKNWKAARRLFNDILNLKISKKAKDK